MAMGCAALSRRRVCVSLVTRHRDSGELGTVFNPFFDVQIWDVWHTCAKHPDDMSPWVQLVDVPFDRPLGLVDAPCVQIIGQVVAEVLVDRAHYASASILPIDRPFRETWPALSRTSRNDFRLSPVDQARRWRAVPVWRRVARRPRALPPAICSEVSRRVQGAVGADSAVTSVWFSVA